MVVSLFVPILATLLMARPSARAAYASVAAGIASLFLVAWHTGGQGYGLASPVFVALLVSVTAFGIVSLGNTGRSRRI
jgi:Na+/pantothenate symporter